MLRWRFHGLCTRQECKEIGVCGLQLIFKSQQGYRLLGASGGALDKWWLDRRGGSGQWGKCNVTILLRSQLINCWPRIMFAVGFIMGQI